jgi:signal transduction histidine kinase
MSVQEYWGSITVTGNELAKMNKAQIEMLERITGGNDSELRSSLNALSLTVGIIGMFLTGGAATVAGLVSATSGVAGSYPSYNNSLAKVMQNGCNSMGKLVSTLLDLPKYDMFEITFPFIYFPDKNIRYVQGEGTIKRAHVKGESGWVSI